MTHSLAVTRYIAWLQSTTPSDMKVLVPISGGSDSALCFWLCNKALPGRVEGIFFGKTLRCADWFSSLGPVTYVNLPTSGRNPEVTRWMHCLEVSLRNNHVLIGSQTKTELSLGTFSNASRVAMVQPLANTWKSDCMSLCTELAFPDQIIASSSLPDIACGRTAKYISFSFEEVDDYLRQKVLETPHSPINDRVAKYLAPIYDSHESKRNFPLAGPII